MVICDMNPTLVKNLISILNKILKLSNSPNSNVHPHNVLNFVLLQVHCSNMKVTQRVTIIPNLQITETEAQKVWVINSR